MSAAVETHAAKGRRYPVKVVEFARRLHEDGRSITDIQLALGRLGHRPARSTVMFWVDPDYREIHNLRTRLRAYPHGRQRQQRKAWWMKRQRMEELRSAGLSFTAVANVMNLDFGLALNHEQARGILNGTLADASTRALLEGKRIRRGRPGAVPA